MDKNYLCTEDKLCWTLFVVFNYKQVVLIMNSHDWMLLIHENCLHSSSSSFVSGPTATSAAAAFNVHSLNFFLGFFWLWNDELEDSMIIIGFHFLWINSFWQSERSDEASIT